MRIMGLDYGSKTVGVAVSDSLLKTAQPRETIRREREGMLRRTLARIEQIAREEDVRLIVVGLPLNMDDSVGERAEAALAFRAMVEKRTGIRTVMSDERLTTMEARELLKEQGIRLSEYKTYVDQVAANLILQEYMENHQEEIHQLAE
jgi:putative Holliday junction resolvase